MTLANPDTGASVYVPAVDHDEPFERARAAVREEQEALAVHEVALRARNDAVRAALEAAPEGMSDNEVARQVGLVPSTFRSITDSERAQRRARRRQR